MYWYLVLYLCVFLIAEKIISFYDKIALYQAGNKI